MKPTKDRETARTPGPGSRVRYLHDGSTPDPAIVVDVLRRVRAIRAKRNRQTRESVMRDCGLVAGRDSMGRRIWE